MRLRVLLLSSLALAACDKPSHESSAPPPIVGAAADSSLRSDVRPTTSTSTSTPTPTASSAPAPSATAEPTTVAAQHVLVAYKGAKNAPKTVTRSKDEAKKRAQEVAAKAKGGADFTALVKEYSDDPAAKDRMGSVGKFTRDKMAKPFADAAFALKVDETSEPVETEFGFHVIKRNQ